MVATSKLEGFRTPGGHIRIPAESVEAARNKRQIEHAPPGRDASPVLHNRRERLEELNLEAQEMRAKRELAKLRREEEQEAAMQEAEAQAREEEAAQRQAELELERERLKHEQTQERIRLQRERELVHQRIEAQEQLKAFHCRWLDKMNEAVSAYEYRWLSAAQRREILEHFETEIEKRQAADEPRMAAIIVRSLESLTEPLRVEHDAQERRQQVTEYALRTLPYSATHAERFRATAAIREVLRAVDSSADESEMRIAAEEAVRPIREVIQRRALEERLISWAIRELPCSRTRQTKQSFAATVPRYLPNSPWKFQNGKLRRTSN
jgi:hypothetical protein